MNASRTILALKLSLVVATALALGTTIPTTKVDAISGAVAIASGSGNVGEEVSLHLLALHVEEPGLGAWTVDVSYDPAVVSLVTCQPHEGSVCGPQYRHDTDRVTGATETGLVGDTVLATMTYRCEAAGVAPLDLDVSVFGDATPDRPAAIDYAVTNGSIACLAGPETVGIGSLMLGVGERGSVDLEALNVPPPGLSSWAVDIVYDPAIVSAVECAARAPLPAPICDESFATDTVRVTAASAHGLSGDLTLAVITFRCEAEGATTLTIDTDIWSTVCPGFCGREPKTQNGSITCVEPSGPTATAPPLLPPTGSGGGPRGTPGWLIVTLAGAGTLALAFGGTLQVRARHP